MALSTAVEQFWGFTKWYSITAAADAPTFDPGQSFNVGDMLLNINPASGQPIFMQCTSLGSGNINPVFSPVVFGGANASRSTTAPTTVTTSDSNVVVTTAGAVTIPAAASLTIGAPYTVINASAGAVTITPATGTISGLAAVTLTAGSTATIKNLGGTLYSV